MGIKISQLPSASTILGTELIPIVQGGATVKTTAASFVPASVPISVTAYGADPTGVADSTTAFNSAAAASNAVYIPQGTYKLTSGVLSFSAGVFFYGASRGAVTLQCTSGTSNLFSWTGSAQGGGISGVLINATGMTGGNIISNIGQARFTVRDCSIVGGYNGIYIQDQNVATIENVWMNNQTGSYAIKNFGGGTSAANVLDINNVEIGFATNTAGSPKGVMIDGDAATIDIRHLAVVKGFRGVSIENTTGGTSGPQFVSGYDVQADYSYDSCLYINGDNGSTGVTRTHQFTDCYFHGSVSADGIYISHSAQFVTIKSAQITSHYKRGIYTLGRYVRINACQIANNSQVGSGTYAGVTIDGTTSGSYGGAYGTNISNNLIGQWVGYAVEKQKYGVEITNGAQAYVVTNNDLRNNVTSDYSDSVSDSTSVIFGNAQASTSSNLINGPIQAITGGLRLNSNGAGQAVNIGDNVNGIGLGVQAQDASSVNFVGIYGKATGSPPEISSGGSDTNIDLVIHGKGTGVVKDNRGIQFPGTLFNTAIPMIVPSSGTIGNNGALSGITSLPATYVNCYMYFPLNAIYAGSAAGMYYVAMSSNTAGTIYNNVYTSGLPSVPGSPTPFVTTGPGAYTQTTGSAISIITYTVPGNLLKINGALWCSSIWSCTNSANNKTATIKYSSAAVMTVVATTSTTINATNQIIQNRGVQNIQVSLAGTLASGSSTGTLTYSAIDSSVNQSLVFGAQLANAGEFLLLERAIVTYTNS